jgi:predicted amidohydrolase YtcJ
VQAVAIQRDRIVAAGGNDEIQGCCRPVAAPSFLI